MFSEELLGEIYTDDRMRTVPIQYSSTVLNVVQESIEKSLYVNGSKDYSKLLRDVCVKK